MVYSIKCIQHIQLRHCHLSLARQEALHQHFNYLQVLCSLSHIHIRTYTHNVKHMHSATLDKQVTVKLTSDHLLPWLDAVPLPLNPGPTRRNNSDSRSGGLSLSYTHSFRHRHNYQIYTPTQTHSHHILKMNTTNCIFTNPTSSLVR